jgi:class 3 adenylate cyclase
LTETMGDDEAVTVSEGFFGAARELLADHGATEVKTIGDALMLEPRARIRRFASACAWRTRLAHATASQRPCRHAHGPGSPTR